MAEHLDPVIDLEAKAEAAYEAMYEAGDLRAAGVCFSEAKELFRDAIEVASSVGATVKIARLEARLAHLKAVFRSQFS